MTLPEDIAAAATIVAILSLAVINHYAGKSLARIRARARTEQLLNINDLGYITDAEVYETIIPRHIARNIKSALARAEVRDSYRASRAYVRTEEKPGGGFSDYYWTGEAWRLLPTTTRTESSSGANSTFAPSTLSTVEAQPCKGCADQLRRSFEAPPK